MFIARMKDKYTSDHDAVCNLYHDNEISIFTSDIFSPDIEFSILPLKVTGTTYEEKKESLRNVAIDYQTLTDCGGLSYGELAEIDYFFETNAKRYGLTKEFKENFII